MEKTRMIMKCLSFNCKARLVKPTFNKKACKSFIENFFFSYSTFQNFAKFGLVVILKSTEENIPEISRI